MEGIMATSESAEIEAVKIQLVAILEEQGEQIAELQKRMNQDALHSKSLESQLAMEREMWNDKEKAFSDRVKQLEKELADLKNNIQHQAHREKVLLSKLNKDVSQKEQLITAMKNSLSKERSRNGELEQQLFQLQQQQHKPGMTSTQKSKMNKELLKEKAAEYNKIENYIQGACTSSGENVKVDAGSVETEEDDELLEAVSVLFSHQQDLLEESEISPYSKENLRVDYMECCHCLKILVDHVMLPCCHGYCIQCIQEFISQGLKDGEDFLWCHICEEWFPIALQKFLQIPLDMKRYVRNLAMRNKKPCEHCVGQKKREILDSEYFCIQCECCVCSNCSIEHMTHSLRSFPHLILAIRIFIFHSELLEPESRLCSEHLDKPLDFYCETCKHLICIKCFADHNIHGLLDIGDYSTAMKDKMKVIQSDMNAEILYLTRMSSSFKRIQKDYSKRIWRIQEKIAENVDLVRYWLQKQAETLNKELNFIAKLSNDGVKSVQNDFENCLTDLLQFRLYTEEFINGAMSSHVACFGEDLLERARNLTHSAREKKLILENFGICKGDDAFHPVKVFFAPNKPRMQTGTRNLVGELKVETVKDWTAVKFSPQLIDIIKPNLVSNERSEFAGLTTLGDELFIATKGNFSIEVYDLTTFTHKQFLSGMTSISDITSCTTRNCLYIYGCNGVFKGILKPDLRGGKAEEMWAVEYDAGRLSVTDKGNIVVTGCNTNSLREYTAEGKLKLELRLKPETGICHLWHALKIETGHFVVSHGIVSDAVQGVCLVDPDGVVLRSYGGSSREQLDIPMYMTFGERGCIMVADLNNRVLQLNAFLELQEELLSSKEGLQWPCRIHFDLVTGRLFVANSNFLENWEVLVFETKRSTPAELNPTK